MNSNNPSPGQLPSSVGQVTDGRPSGGQGSAGQVDMASVMSQVLHSPALDGLLTGVSEQTGMGSSDGLRNMLQQFAQSPQMRNAVNQIAQQVDSQDVESVFSGLGGQGGGIDFSRMFQQMMPIVSRALGSGSTASQPFSLGEPQPQPQYNQRDLSRDEHDEQNLQVTLSGMICFGEHFGLGVLTSCHALNFLQNIMNLVSSFLIERLQFIALHFIFGL